MGTVAEVWVYPVKSAKGVPLEAAVVTRTGFFLDRQWVVTKENGKFITQRQLPKMALVSVAIDPPQLLQGAEPTAFPDAALVLKAPGMSELRVPLFPSRERKLVPVTVWDWTGLGADEGDAAGEWFSEYLGMPARLVRYSGQPTAASPPDKDPLRRQVELDWTPDPGCEVAFADGFPFLLANQASMTELNRSLPEPLPIDRFRANVVLSGLGAYEEDTWDRIQLGSDGVSFEMLKPCSRCKVTTINQQTAEEGKEPLETMYTVRSGKVLGWLDPPPFKNSVFFGWNAATLQTGVVHVGDQLQVLSARTKPVGPFTH